MARKFSSVGSTLRTSTPFADGAADGVAAAGVQVAQQLVFLRAQMSSSAVESLGCRLWVLTRPAPSMTPLGGLGEHDVRLDLDGEDAQPGALDELGVGRGDARDVLDGRHIRALDEVPELAQEREGLLQDQVVARVVGRLVHEVEGLPAEVLLDLGERLRLQEIAAVGVRGDVGIPVGDLFGRGKAGGEFTQGCGIQSLRYERRRHADMQVQVYPPSTLPPVRAGPATLVSCTGSATTAGRPPGAPGGRLRAPGTDARDGPPGARDCWLFLARLRAGCGTRRAGHRQPTSTAGTPPRTRRRGRRRTGCSVRSGRSCTPPWPWRRGWSGAAGRRNQAGPDGLRRPAGAEPAVDAGLLRPVPGARHAGAVDRLRHHRGPGRGRGRHRAATSDRSAGRQGC